MTSTIDWSVLRKPLMFLVIALLIAGGLVFAAQYFGDDVSSAHNRESNRLTSARGRYLTLDDEKRLIADFYPRYQQLEARGTIGGEQRLNWVETLRQAAAAVKVPSLQYQIASRNKVRPDFPLDSGEFSLMMSEMNLDIGLLHEGDLFRLFQELEIRASGLFHVTDCRIERLTEQFSLEKPDKANLRAVCRIAWYTLVPEDDAGGQRA
ncbi:MAG: hypothetical protein AAF493_16335 [Pseudomonadota bacterium]